MVSMAAKGLTGNLYILFISFRYLALFMVSVSMSAGHDK